MTEFNRESLEFHLPEFFKDMSKEYMLSAIFNEELQKSWEPEIGDIMVGPTGNIFVISGTHDLVEELGGMLYFFGGGLCNRSRDSHILEETYCFTMNKSGKWLSYAYDESECINVVRESENSLHSSISDFRWVPYPHIFDNYIHTVIIDGVEYVEKTNESN